MIENVVVVLGNLTDGFNILGPFEGFDAAIEYAEINIKNEEWWATELKNPNRNTNDYLEVPF